MRKLSIILLVLLAIVILGLGAFYFWPNPVAKAPIEIAPSGISVLNPIPGQLANSPLTIIGYVSGDGWTGFEGQVGTVRLVDALGKELAAGILTATGDWTKLPTDFKTVLSFQPPGAGNGQLIFKNENASGEAVRDKEYKLPVTFK